MKPSVVVAAAKMIVSSLLLFLLLFLVQGSSSSSEHFWGEKMDEGEENGRSRWGIKNYYTVGTVLLILIFQMGATTISFGFRFVSFKSQTAAPSSPPDNTASSSNFDIISDLDLKNLISDLDEKFHDNVQWDNVIDKSNNLLSYNAKCCKPKDEPLKYFSVTVFDDCSIELLRDFYLDNDYRKSWDQTVIEHEQLQVDEISGTEIGRTLKKFPFLTIREYILAWRLWEGRDRTFYCFTKECEHPLAPRQKKYVRVGFYTSGWRIRKVPASNACEIKVVHQEDAGLNVDMAKLAFAKGIWSYVCKMNDALRKYPAVRCTKPTSDVNAINLIQKVPPELDMINITNDAADLEPSVKEISSQVAQGSNEKKLIRRPSSNLIAKGLIILGGVVCLSRSHSNLGAKVAMAYVLSKLAKRGASSGGSG